MESGSSVAPEGAFETENLATIDENLIRNELTQLERAEALARRKELYEAKYPEAKRGTAGAIGSNKSQGRKIDASETVSFAIDTAAKTGLTPRTIQQDVQVATQYVFSRTRRP